MNKYDRLTACLALQRSLLIASRLRRDRRAVVALEFALVGPVFMLFLFTSIGVGLVGFSQAALDDAVREASRQIQINGPAAASASNFLTAVCRNFGKLASSCETRLTYNVQGSSPTAGFAGLSPATLNAAGNFGNNFFSSGTTFAANVNVLVQVSYPLPYTLPFIGKLITFTGTNSILSTSTIRVEPFG